jgi:DHA1 family multidrug resistance protein-like MFS transporter
MKPSVLKQLVPLLFAVFVSMLGVGIISPILPVYAEMMGAGGFAIGIIFGLFSLSRSIVMPVYGRISDLKGRKIFIIIGLSAYCVLSFAYVAADTIFALAVVRLLHGLASAATIPIVMAYVGDISPEGQEGRLMGIYTTVLLLGFGSGPVIGGVVKDALGMNEAFYIMGGLVFVGLLMVIFMVSEPDGKGKVSEKYPYREIFENKRIRALFVFRLANSVGRSAIFAFLPIFGHNLLSLSGTSIGILLSAVVIVASLFQVPSGILADRISRVGLVTAGGILNALCLTAIGFCKSFGSLAVVVGFIGLSGAIALPALTALAVGEGRNIGMGSVMGVFNFAMSIGQSFGPFVAGYMMSVSGIRAPFYFAGIVAIMGTGYFLSGMVAANKEVIRDGR